jgi:hypothetical protein
MKTFKHFLEERFINLLHDDPRKQQYASEVHGMLQKAYEKIGGIQGSGFNSPEDMVKNIPMWKLHKKGGKIRGVVMYKDTNGRKSVATATDGSEEGKKGVAQIYRDDVVRDRAYGERSASALSFTKKVVGAEHLKKHIIPYEHVQKTLGGDTEIRRPPADDPEIQRHPEFADHFYQRKIGDKWHTKLMFGTPGKSLK